MVEATYASEDGLTLFYRDEAGPGGDKLPVLCLPGLTRNSRDFTDLVSHISHARRVISPDFRGRGFSDWDPNYQNYVPMTYAQDVLVLCDQLKLDKVIIIGTSLGGLVAMILAALRPSLVAGVVLNDVGAEIDTRGLDRIRSYVGLLKPISSWPEAMEAVKLTNSAAHPNRPDAFWEKFAQAACRENAQGVPQFDYDPKIGDAVREAPPADPQAGWMAFGALANVPTLVVRGAISDLLSAETVVAMKARKGDLKSVEVAGVGHAPYLDEPEASEAIDAFLAELP